ncbi:hypothetical protein LEN26_021109 [Aphanomyces euteiches]|nr:hypothetical protein LEN26_021109 [Aphanomyces euteiches]KAH9115433.1 hypothetical protein AeMF1_010526 [Aphanomyces euteiches]KAH9186497.1 hypothetical protein AeNC1_011528 [Aphanomyces euteiches]
MSSDEESRPRKQASKRHKDLISKPGELDNPDVDAIVADLLNVQDINDNRLGDSSRRQDKSARKQFMQFLGPSIQSFETIPVEIVSKDTIGKFCSFLLSNTTIGFQASMNYLSCIRRQLETQFKTSIFNDNSGWYSNTRRQLAMQYVLKSLKDGTKLKDQAPPMTIHDLTQIGEILFRQNDLKSFGDRTLLNAQWASIGRASDVGNIRYQVITWMDGFIIGDITRRKVSKQHSLSIFPSALIWQIDMVHFLACQLVCNRYSASDKIFYHMGHGSSELKTAAYINRLMKAIYKLSGSNDLTPDLMSHSNRRGAAIAAASNQHVSLPDLAHRGQWAVESFSKLMEYLSETWHGDQTVGRALSGWEQPNLRVFSASLEAISSDPGEQIKINSFVDSLFGFTMDRLSNRSFANAMTAALLMYLRDTLHACEKHMLHKTLLEAGQAVFCDTEGIVRTILLKWGENIRTKFIMDNLTQLKTSVILQNLPNDDIAKHFVGANTFSDVLEKLVLGYRTLMGEVLNLRGLTFELQNLVKSQSNQLASIHNLLVQNGSNVYPPSSDQGIEKSYMNIPNIGHIRSWPSDFTSLANIQFSDLIVRYLAKSLWSIPLERNNKVQHRVIQAIKIAEKFYPIKKMMMKPPSRVPTENEMKLWRTVAVEIQSKILDHIQANRDTKERKRGPTGAVEGALKLWSKLRLDSTI